MSLRLSRLEESVTDVSLPAVAGMAILAGAVSLICDILFEGNKPDGNSDVFDDWVADIDKNNCRYLSGK